MREKKLLAWLLGLSIMSYQLVASECVSNYDYVDKHHVLSEINHKMYAEEVQLKGTLHVRYLERNASKYTLFWFENGVLEKEKLDRNSLNIPFIVKNKSNGKEFLIDSLDTVSKEYKIRDKLIGLVELLQFSAKGDKQFFKNSMGKVKVSEKVTGQVHNIERNHQYIQDMLEKDITYYQSDVSLTIGVDTCHLWQGIKGEQEIKFMNPLLNNSTKDKQRFQMRKSTKVLPKGHWFFDLSTDVNTWGFKKKKNSLSLNDALMLFDAKQQEMLALLGDSKALEKWIRENLDFLEHLSVMLEGKSLNDSVSKSLFSHLSYINNSETSKILSEVTLNENILEKERFRSLMGLKNTDALIPEALLDDIVEYGLNSTGDDFMVESTGMLIGALAKERLERYPEQAEQIVSSIIDAVNNSTNKKVALAAAGNMLTLAPDNLVETVDNMMLSTTDAKTVGNSADVLMKIERSTLGVEAFQELFDSQKSLDTQARLIKASASAKDFLTNQDYQESLVNLAKNKGGEGANRLAALETLQKTNFGKSAIEKKRIRKMMIGEKSLQVSKVLKSLYRRQ